MKINIKRIGENFNLQATSEEGHAFIMDASQDIGGENTGMRPMQVLLSSLGGCSAIDVILILKKQKQEVDSFEVELTGDREKIEDYSLFKNIILHFKIKGKLEFEKVERAVKLSLEKYCSVAKTLEPTANITYKITLN
ncbi:disulfide bond formation regulator [Sphingobacteriaceae bacterium]|nr:disulfide bond formation regulator [Sphingobacteriaceae bacterium]